MFVRVLVILLACAPSAAAQSEATVSVFSSPLQGKGSTASVLIGIEVEGDSGVRRFITRRPMTPGKHRLYLGTTDAATGRTSVVAHDVEVPDLAPGVSRLAMSGVLLSASDVSGTTEADVEDDLALPVLALPATARRTFSRHERLEVHAEFYEQQSGVDIDTQLRIVTRLLAADGTVLFTTEDHGTSEWLLDNRWGYEHSTLVPIGMLEPGSYTVEIIGETLYDVPASIARSVAITIR